MRTYYFDMKDGVPVRDRVGLQFATAAGAIEHSKELARRFSHEHPLRDRDLAIVVIDEWKYLADIGDAVLNPAIPRA